MGDRPLRPWLGATGGLVAFLGVVILFFLYWLVGMILLVAGVIIMTYAEPPLYKRIPRTFR